MECSVLVIESSAAIRQQLRFILTGGGFRIEETADCWSALRLLGGECFSLIIADEDAPQEERECILRHLRDPAVRSPIPMLLLCREQHAERDTAEGTVRMPKPFSTIALISTLRRMGIDPSAAEHHERHPGEPPA